MSKILPISTLLPTRNRVVSLRKMLNSLAEQSVQPEEIIIIDASENQETKKLCISTIPDLKSKLVYYQAQEKGAAIQRNQAIKYATQDWIWFIEDDIIFEPNCLQKLWQALENNHKLGGVNAMITNQKYSPPGKISSYLFKFLHGRYETSYAGKCIGPALNLLPEDNPNLPEVVAVEWLNTTCVLYRREALPQPIFSSFFTGYSLLEDVTLSLTVGKQWQLANARTAKIFHDSQPGEHKNNPTILAQMDLVNRHYVMTQILEQKTLQDYLKLIILQLFGIAASLVSFKGWLELPVILWGKIQAIAIIAIADYTHK